MAIILNDKINFIQLLKLLILISMLGFSGCDKQVSRSPVESEAPKGFMYINSVPNGFTIFQNGRNTGRLTPDSISYIDAGSYEITLKKKYFKDTSVVVNLSEDEKLTIDIDILSNPSMYGGLYIQSTPNAAQIFINDSSTAKLTPSELTDLLPGEYNIKLSLANHRNEEFTAIVQSSKINSYTEALRDTSVWVDYQVINSRIQSNSLTSIVVDDNNVKWIGSIDKGLIRFDETNFINYDITNSAIPSNKINCIAVDFLNRIWVGTDHGLGIFDGSSWVVYNKNNSGLTNDFINTIKFYDNNIVWIGTSGNLVRFDGIDWVIYDQPAGKDWINDIYI